jgi:outer membrane receptor protein involved in Fe transport
MHGRRAGRWDLHPRPEPAASQGDITVTGSRIRRPNIESNVPIVSVTAEDLTSQGDVNVGDALNDLPSLRSTFSQANSTRFIGTSGLNLLDLRGLGISRTLVLVNGRRHITSLPGDYIVDVNTIPTDLLERVDVITGGSSSIYGSDAVAGVVNFVTRRDFDGFRVRAQGGVSQQGDRAIEFVSATFGRNFWDDRANIAINLEYVNAEALYFTDRPELTGAYDGRCQINASEFTGPPGQVPAENRFGDGVPDATYLCGVRNANIGNGGMLSPAGVSVAICQSTNPAVLTPALAPRCLNPGTPLGQPRMYRFTNSNTLIEDVPCLDLRPYPTGAGGNYIACPTQDRSAVGSTLRDTGLIAPGLDRYTANLLFHMDVSDAFRPFLELKYVHIFSRQEGQPSFFSAGLLGTFACNNPYVTPQQLTQLQAIGRCANPATGTFPVNRFNVDFGGRSALETRDTYRAVFGVQGDFNEDWNYEIAFNYGHLDQHSDELNDLVLFDVNGNPDGYLLAFDAVRNGAGQIVCRVNQVAVTRPDCVPINVFGVGSPSAAALDFVNTTSFVDQEATEYNAVAYVNGDLSQMFELPGGPVRFVLGAEWRRETAFLQPDDLSAASGTFFNAFQVFDPPALEVLEGFGEIEIPLLRDLPFAHELTVTGAARYSDYNTSAGNTFAYNISGTWAPVRDVRFRANYSKSVRVPTQSDLYFPQIQNFNLVADPCDTSRLNLGGANREANCRALGVPIGFVATAANTSSISFRQGGNDQLTEETSKSLTLGVVVTPRWVPGLSITVDYYRIRVNNLIAALTAQTILNQCVDLPDIANQFCALINPRQTTDDITTPQNDVGALASPALTAGPVNFARQEAEGIDIEAAYRRTFDNGHRLNVRGIATYVLKRNNFVDPTFPNIGDRQLSELGDPVWSANLNITYGIGPFDFRYSMNYIGPQVIGTYEQYFQIPENAANTPTNVDANNIVWYPDVLYHNARMNYRVNERFQFYMGVDNLFDTPPPLGVFGTGAGDPFDPIGRYFYAGATVDF